MRAPRPTMDPRVLLGGLLLIALFLPVLAWTLPGTRSMGPGMMWGYGVRGDFPAWNGWEGVLLMGVSMVAMVAFWAAVLIGIALLARWALTQGEHSERTGPTNGAADEPLTILNRRYAAGEIDRETYEQMRREITTPHDVSH